LFFLVRAAFRAASERPRAPFVRAAFSAAFARARGPRFRATRFACRESSACDAARVPSRSSARVVARERTADGRFRVYRVDTVAFLVGGGPSFTPARLAFESTSVQAIERSDSHG
jgi:hypothetical protein